MRLYGTADEGAAPTSSRGRCHHLSLQSRERTVTLSQALHDPHAGGERADYSLGSGGRVAGLGETMAQRVEFACYLRSLAIRSIPINILQPIAGTPLAQEPRLTDEEYLRTVALFRLINPTAFLRFSGGRLRLSPEVMRQAMYIGINSAITGDMLTTSGMQAREDMQLIAEMGYRNTNEKEWRTEETA